MGAAISLVSMRRLNMRIPRCSASSMPVVQATACRHTFTHSAHANALQLANVALPVGGGFAAGLLTKDQIPNWCETGQGAEDGVRQQETAGRFSA